MRTKSLVGTDEMPLTGLTLGESAFLLGLIPNFKLHLCWISLFCQIGIFPCLAYSENVNEQTTPSNIFI
jgi:hypothetical protein